MLIRHLRASRSWDPDATRLYQDVLTQTVYFLSLQGILTLPPQVKRQVDTFLSTLDDELRGRSLSVLEDDAFELLAAKLSAQERQILRKLLGHDLLLWALQDCPMELAELFTGGLGSRGSAEFLSELKIRGYGELPQAERQNRVANARIDVIDLARLVMRFRSVVKKGSGKRALRRGRGRREKSRKRFG